MTDSEEAYFKAFSNFLLTGESKELELYLSAEEPCNPEYLMIYRNGFFKASIEALGQNFPVVKLMVGEDYFSTVAREFVKQFPSQKGTLVGYGDGFGEFIAMKSNKPWLDEMATLDQAWMSALNASENTLPEIEGLDFNLLSEMKFQPSDTVIFAQLQFSVFDAWVQLKTGQTLTKQHEVSRQVSTVVFWRYQDSVQAHVLSIEQQHFLMGLQQGLTLGQVLYYLEQEFDLQQIEGWISEFLINGILKRDS